MASMPTRKPNIIYNEAVPPEILLGNPRDDDPTTLFLRRDRNLSIELDDIASNLALEENPISIGSSSAAPTYSVFSSQKESTNPTSNGTSYPVDGRKGKGVATYSSSLSATQGSSSDTERDMDRDNALLGMGDWAGVTPQRTPKRTHRRQGAKKPPLIIQGDRVPSDDYVGPATRHINRRDGRNSTKYLRNRRNHIHENRLELAEEGRISEASTLSSPNTLSNTRLYIMISLILATVLTLAVGIWAAHHTGKVQMRWTKGIIFLCTVLISFFTVFAMITARRALQEALLMGVFEFLVGFALLVQIHEFM